MQQEISHDFQTKIDHLRARFAACTSPEDKYRLIIALGEELPPMDPSLQTENTLVRGCQSLLFLHVTKIEDRYFFKATSDALISKGLAALLIAIYDGEEGSTILSNPPHFLADLGLSISPNRAQGLLHIYLKMKNQTTQ